MKETDQRVRRTRQRLAEALIALTVARGYDAVTIREITARADVGYATFFRHYPDKDALLDDVLDVFLQQLLDLLQPQQIVDDPIASHVLMFRFVAEHINLFRVLLSSHSSPMQMRRVREVGISRVFAQHAAREDAAVPPEIAANHLVMAAITLIAWWVEHDLLYSAEQMAQILQTLIVEPTQRLAFTIAPGVGAASDRRDGSA